MNFLRLISVIFIVIFSLQTTANPGHIALNKGQVREYKELTTDSLMKSYLELTSLRHQVLSENMANINTPGYKANDMTVPSNYKDLTPAMTPSRKVRMAITSEGHLLGKNKERGSFSSHKLKNPYETKPNGNNVSMQQQMEFLAQNRQDYTTALKTYSSSNNLVSSALGK